MTTRACLANVLVCGWDRWVMSRFRFWSDAQWDLIGEFLPGPTGRKGRPFADARTKVEGIVYRYQAGIAWLDLSAVFGPWQMVWARHHRMAGDAIWNQGPGTRRSNTRGTCFTTTTPLMSLRPSRRNTVPLCVSAGKNPEIARMCT